MPDSEPLLEVKRVLLELFRAGLPLDSDTAAFIDSTYGPLDAPAIGRLLNAGSDADRDTLVDLLFVPDPNVQLRLEPLLKDQRFGEDAPRQLAAMLCADAEPVRMRLPHGRGSLRMVPPGWALERFVDGLNLRWRPPPEVAAAISRCVPQGLRDTVRLRLRNLNYRPADTARAVFCRFLERFQPASGDYLETLDFLLAFLGDMGDDTDVYAALMQRKALCRRHLQQALKQERELRNHNVETLLIQGRRIFYFDTADLMRTMNRIDTISLTLFDRTESLVPPAGSTDLGDIQKPEDLERLVRILSSL